MPSSMTGFGQASFADKDMSADVIVRSINGKHLKTKVRLGLGMPAVEERITSLIARHMRRGTVDVNLRLDWAGASGLALNERMIAGYASKLQKLSKTLGLPAEISLDRVALRMAAGGKVRLDSVISDVVDLSDPAAAYDKAQGEPDGKVVLQRTRGDS